MGESIEDLRAEMKMRVERARRERAAHVPRRLRPEILDRVEAAEQAITALRAGLISSFEAADVEVPEVIRPAPVRHLRLIRGERAG